MKQLPIITMILMLAVMTYVIASGIYMVGYVNGVISCRG